MYPLKLHMSNNFINFFVLCAHVSHKLNLIEHDSSFQKEYMITYWVTAVHTSDTCTKQIQRRRNVSMFVNLLLSTCPYTFGDTIYIEREA
jgi:hypothetical protein